MLHGMTSENFRERINALEGERDALTAHATQARQRAAELAFDAETDNHAKSERNRLAREALDAQTRLAEIDAALAGARVRLDKAVATEERARKQSAAREAHKLAEQRAKAARGLDRALADAERAFAEYADLQPELATKLRAADAASPEEARLLATRTSRAVRFAAWAQAPRLATALGGPRATMAHRRPLAEANEAATPLPALEAEA